MSAVFVHVSDIHFGQEQGGVVYVHDDVKARVIEDVAVMVAKLPAKRANGILVTGDIAYAGKHSEYKTAGKWLDALAAAVGCEQTDVHVVPGNHDIDRDEISMSAEFLLSRVDAEGESALDAIIASDTDREVFYRRFCAYRPFAEGYDCPLDNDGTLTQSKRIELTDDRAIRIWGLNSALICSKRKAEEGNLLLGARQRVLPIKAGEELVVLAHHPLSWLKDSADAKRYIRNRARVFISGHEHAPKVHIDKVRPGCDLMMLASGAMIPPTADEIYNYTYNLIEFDWDVASDALAVTVHPRAWADDEKAFKDAPEQLDGKGPRFVLACSQYGVVTGSPSMPQSDSECVRKSEPDIDEPRPAISEEVMPDEFPLLLLRFFRDLSPGQRLSVLAQLKVVPDGWNEALTHSTERKIVDGLVRSGRLDELQKAVEALTGGGENKKENE